MTDRFKNVLENFIDEHWLEFTYSRVKNKRPDSYDDWLQDSVSLDDLGADSLDFTLFIFELEEEYKIDIDEELLVNRGRFGVATKTFGEICEIVENISSK